jgi:hypothetical protein
MMKILRRLFGGDPRERQIAHIEREAGARFFKLHGMTVRQYFERYELAYSVDEITHAVDDSALYRHLCGELGLEPRR